MMRESETQLEIWEERILSAKKEHRPKLKDWQKDGYGRPGPKCDAFEQFSNTQIYEPFNGSNNWKIMESELPLSENFSSCSVNSNGSAVPRVHASQLSLLEFRDSFEKPELPVIIGGIPYIENWKSAMCGIWTLARLENAFGDVKMKCGEDDDGYAIKIRLKYFMSYLKNQQDDSPLYIFDSHFDDHDIAKALLNDYKVPSYFPDDLFELVGEKLRPPYRWFLIGPKRSGTCCHIDPLGTSAWNTVLVGRKRWVIFPPHVSGTVAKGKTVIRKNEDDEAINYFLEHIPRLREESIRDPSIQMFEFIQYPGETVFVPGGWWHAVINLDDTIAVTQNFCSRVNFAKVWRKTRKGRKKMAVKWLRQLHKKYPSLAELAETINKEDRFVMANKRNEGDHSKSHKKSSKKEKRKKKDEENKQHISPIKRRKGYQHL